MHNEVFVVYLKKNKNLFLFTKKHFFWKTAFYEKDRFFSTLGHIGLEFSKNWPPNEAYEVVDSRWGNHKLVAECMP